MNRLFSEIPLQVQKMSGRILDNLGITINLHECPEYMAYHNYIFGAHWIVKKFRLIFRKGEIARLKRLADTAFLILVLEQESEAIDNKYGTYTHTFE